MKKIEVDYELVNKIAVDIKNKHNKEFNGYEGKIIYRPHRGGSVFDTIKEAREFNNIQEMKEYIVKQWDNNFSIDDVMIKDESNNDDRINWKDVRYVCIKRLGKEDYMSKYGSPQCIGYCATDYK